MVRNRLIAVVLLATLIATGVAAPRPLGGDEKPRPPAGTTAVSLAAPLAPAPNAALRRDGFAGPLAARLVHVVDGDTFEARVRVWFGQEIATLVRIRGLDTPELKGRCLEEVRLAAASRDLLTDFLASGPLVLRDIAPDKYFGRVVASVSLEGDDVADLMTATQLARVYRGGPRGGWCAAAR